MGTQPDARGAKRTGVITRDRSRGEGLAGARGPMRRLIIRGAGRLGPGFRPPCDQKIPALGPVPAFPGASHSGDVPRFPTAARSGHRSPPSFRRRSAAPPGPLRATPRADQRPLPADDSAAPSPGSRPACPWPPEASRAGSHPRRPAPASPRRPPLTPPAATRLRPPRSALKGRARPPRRPRGVRRGTRRRRTEDSFSSGRGQRGTPKGRQRLAPPNQKQLPMGHRFRAGGSATAGRLPRTWNGADHENGTDAFRPIM